MLLLSCGATSAAPAVEDGPAGSDQLPAVSPEVPASEAGASDASAPRDSATKDAAVAADGALPPGVRFTKCESGASCRSDPDWDGFCGTVAVDMSTPQFETGAARTCRC